jgi:hypothetical protein
VIDGRRFDETKFRWWICRGVQLERLYRRMIGDGFDRTRNIDWKGSLLSELVL